MCLHFICVSKRHFSNLLWSISLAIQHERLLLELRVQRYKKNKLLLEVPSQKEVGSWHSSELKLWALFLHVGWWASSKTWTGRYVLEMHCIIYSPQNVEPTVFPPCTPLTFLPLKSCINTHLLCGWTRARQNCCFFCFVSSAEIKKGRSCWAILASEMLLLYLVTEEVQPVNLVCRKWEFGGLEY